MEALCPILHRRVPNHLEELRLENCNIPAEVMRELLADINHKSYLRSLSLVNVNLNDDTFIGIIDLVKDSNLLEEIDISWSNLLSSSMSTFLQLLTKNRKLEYINLSWNKLFDPSEKDEIAPGKGLTSNAQFVVDCICTIIKYNPNLIHLDLSNTGLTEPMMWHFGQALRRAKSLRSIHLCGNVGITDELVEYLTKRTHGAKITQMN